MMTRTEAQALATFITKVRPDWDHPGIIAAIGKAQAKATPLQVARALVNLAENRELRTPALLAEAGQHWRDGAEATGPNVSHDVRCPDHPRQVHPCPECRATARPVTDDELAALRAIVHGTPKHLRRHEPKPRDLETVRARADQEAS